MFSHKPSCHTQTADQIQSQVNGFKSYDELRAENVLSTMQLVALLLIGPPRRIFYISTASVATDGQHIASHSFPWNAIEGYVQTEAVSKFHYEKQSAQRPRSTSFDRVKLAVTSQVGQ